MEPFIIISLPRSMSAWVANWFTQDGVLCYHEGNSDYFTLGNLYMNNDNHKKRLGDCSSSLALMNLDEILSDKFTGKIGYIERDKEECIQSYDKVNPVKDQHDTRLIINVVKECIDKILSKKKHFKINYKDLLKEDKFKLFHEYLTPEVLFSSERYNMLKDLVVTQKVEEVYNRKVKQWQQH